MNRLMHRKRKENMETPTLRMSDRILSVVAITGLLVTILAGVQILGGVTIINLSNGNEPQTAVISDGVQIVDAPITKKGFTSIIVQRDIPCEIHFRVMTGLDECNNEVVIPKFDQDIKLSEGDNVVTILPDEVGVFPYTCGMNMIQATITVAQSIDYAGEAYSKTASGGNASQQEGGSVAGEAYSKTASGGNASKQEGGSVAGEAYSKTASGGNATQQEGGSVAGEAYSKTASGGNASQRESGSVAGEAYSKTASGGNASQRESGSLTREENHTDVGEWMTDQLTPGQDDSVAAREIQTWEGWLFDRCCIGIDPFLHTKSCNLMGGCLRSGLGIIPYIPGKEFDTYTAKDCYLNFDSSSKALTEEFLKNLPEDWSNNVTVRVKGYVVNNIPAGADELLIPETDETKVDHYLTGIHITEIEAANIDGLSTNVLPEPNLCMSQQ